MSTTDTRAQTRRTAPITTRSAAALLAVLAIFHGYGVFYFTVLAPEAPLGAVLGFTAVAVAAALVALAAVPGLLRGYPAAWTVALCWAVALAYWTAYKAPVEDEPEALIFLALDGVLLALLMAPASRRHAEVVR